MHYCRKFYDQPINDMIKLYDEIRKIATGQGDNYTAEFLLDYQYFKDHYNLIAIGISSQKELDADSRAVQQIEFYGMLKSAVSKKITRNDFRILQRNSKSSVNSINLSIQ